MNCPIFGYKWDSRIDLSARQVADGLQDKELAQEGERLVEEAERELKQKENQSD